MHITSDEIQTWDQIYRSLATAAGVREPELVHVTTDAIADAVPDWGPGLIGDKTHSVIFDNGLVKLLVPGWVATTSFADGARELVAWHDAEPGRAEPDPKVQHRMDELLR